MEETTENLSVVRVIEKIRETKQDLVVKESFLTIFLNNQELVTLVCTPENLKSLAVGFLHSEGILYRGDDLKKVVLDEGKGIIWIEAEVDEELAKKLMFRRLITSGCGKGATFYSPLDRITCKRITSEMKLSTQEIFNLVNMMQHKSALYKTTGGVHSACLCDNKDILAFCEDIGRHNAIDKTFGKCLLEGIKTEDRIMITTGRVSSEILLKMARMRIPIVVSRSCPTSLAVKHADELGITLVGFARGKRMNIYANDFRIVD